MFFVLTVSLARVPTRRFPAMEVIFSGSHGSEAGPMSSTFPQGNCCGVDASLSVNAEPDGARSEEWKNSQSTVVKSLYQPHAKVAVLNTAPSPMHNASHARGGTRKDATRGTAGYSTVGNTTGGRVEETSLGASSCRAAATIFPEHHADPKADWCDYSQRDATTWKCPGGGSRQRRNTN